MALIARGNSLGATGKWPGLLLAGIVLVGVGLVLLIAPQSIRFSVWLRWLWPLFLVLAGLFRVAGFAIERRPRSPLGGALLVAVGMVLLLGRIGSESSALAIYGKYWILVLGIYSSAELLRFYSHRQGDGQHPKFFSLSKLLAVLFIASTGILSSRLAGRSESVLSMVRIHASLASLTDAGGVHTYRFEDPPSLTEVNGSPIATISNSRGSVNIIGSARSLRVVLTKTVTAPAEFDARNLAEQIKLVVEKTAGGIRISTNRDQVGGDTSTDMKIELPRGLPIAVVNNNGSVSLSGGEGQLSINASGGPVSVAQITGNVEIALDGSSSLDARNVVGNVSVEGARDARITNIGGGLDLKASNGSVELSQIKGPVRVDAGSCKIRASDLIENSTIKARHSAIDIIKSSSLDIDAPGSSIKAQQVSGDLRITSSDGSVRLLSVQGAVTVSASHSSVMIDGLKGEARVEASYAPVVVKNFRGGAFVETSYDRVVIAPGDPIADIQVKNSHGDIRLTLPRSGEFRLSAQAAQGSIKCPDFYGSPSLDGAGANLSFGASGPKIVLATVQGDITLEEPGSRRPVSLVVPLEENPASINRTPAGLRLLCVLAPLREVTRTSGSAMAVRTDGRLPHLGQDVREQMIVLRIHETIGA
jgi:DUF4097 and DUF4098 domain-containing protein YvlB